MATPQEAPLNDPTFWQFADHLLEKGYFPLLVLAGLFALIWRYGWPKLGADVAHPPPQPNAVVEALGRLRDEVLEMRDDTHERLEKLAARLEILLDRTGRK